MNLKNLPPNFPREAALILVALVLAGGIGWIYYENNQPKSFEFGGLVEAVGEKSLQVRGYFLAEGGNPLGPEDGAEVVIGPETKIIRTYLLMPTKAELEESGGVWYPAKLASGTEQVGIEALRGREGIPVRIITNANVFNAERFEAETVEYVDQIYPEE